MNPLSRRPPWFLSCVVAILVLVASSPPPAAASCYGALLTSSDCGSDGRGDGGDLAPLVALVVAGGLLTLVIVFAVRNTSHTKALANEAPIQSQDDDGDPWWLRTEPSARLAVDLMPRPGGGTVEVSARF